MPLFLISYDLRAPGRNYKVLYECMANFRAQRLLESVWLAELKGPAEEIRNLVRGTVDANDSLVVIEITAHADWATRHVPIEATGLLRKHSP